MTVDNIPVHVVLIAAMSGELDRLCLSADCRTNLVYSHTGQAAFNI